MQNTAPDGGKSEKTQSLNLHGAELKNIIIKAFIFIFFFLYLLTQFRFTKG